MNMKPKLKVVQVRSACSRPKKQQAILHGLGLRGPRQQVIVANTPSFRGAIKKVLHLVTVEETNG